MYEYKVTILKVIDGDTIDAKVDLGFRVSMEMRFRLAGINAPELSTQSGKASKARLQEWLPVGSIATVRSQKDRQEKYGRYLGTFYDLDGHDINARMVMEGLAVPYMEGKK